MKDRVKIVHENFLSRVQNEDFPDSVIISPQSVGLSSAQLIEIFESQILSRQLDIASRELQAIGEGFYTIGSAGHEGNAAVAAALNISDMAFLHYRDAAFFIQRSKQLAGQTPLWDMLLSFTASSDDPISAGRHKVLGSKALNIPPQTSTIASHLPKAVGAAYSTDTLVYCSFGDASVNHSTAQGAFNSACWAAYQKASMPIMFLCEDNDIGISTPTPNNWIYNNFKNRPVLKYFYCNGLNALETYQTVSEAASYARKHKSPVFVHKKCVRLFGHAGADVQSAYMSREKMESDEANDPLLHSSNLIIQNNILSSAQILDIYNEIGQRVRAAAKQVIKRPKLMTSAQVQASIVPCNMSSRAEVTPQELFGSSKTNKAPLCFVPRDLKISPLPSVSRDDKCCNIIRTKQPQHMARLLNWALHDLMLNHDNIVMMGEDIAQKGGVYNVTAKLHDKFGAKRVINTPIDEQTILGLAIGMAHNGILPIPEIQFLAYLHNAEDQLRGEAATLSFFSNGQYTNPMVIRIAGLAYQKGFGGHFHNDNSFAVLRDIPGIIIACPSNGADAVEMMREAVRLAHEEQRIVVFLEPIALYMTRDLHEEKDGLWTSLYADTKPIALGDIHVHGKGKELCILTYGNGYYLSRQAAKVLEGEHGIKLRVIDMRWLAPLNEEAIIKAIKPCKYVLIVDECRRTGSISEALMAMIMENIEPLPKFERLTADDCFIPLGKAYAATLPSKDKIIAHALELMEGAL